MTDRRLHTRAPLRRTSSAQRILSAGLATATCVGLVGVIGARTIEAKTTSDSVPDDSSTAAPQSMAGGESAVSSAGLTQADLDAYATQLAAEKQKLDAYRAKLVKTAKKLQRQADRQAARASSGAAASSGSSSVGRPAAASTTVPQSPAARPQAKPAPRPAAAPAPKPAPAPAKPHSTSKAS